MIRSNCCSWCFHVLIRSISGRVKVKGQNMLQQAVVYSIRAVSLAFRTVRQCSGIGMLIDCCQILFIQTPLIIIISLSTDKQWEKKSKNKYFSKRTKQNVSSFQISSFQPLQTMLKRKQKYLLSEINRKTLCNLKQSILLQIQMQNQAHENNQLPKLVIEQKIQRRKLQIVIVSDTHGEYSQLNKIAATMKGDVFIHAGDFTDYGIQKDFLKFFEFLDNLTSFKYKIVIAGNHQISLDNGCIINKKKQIYLNTYPCKLNRAQIITQLKKRCIYLQHQAVQIEGVKIFGSPYTPYFVGNAFQYRKNQEYVIWDAIPHYVDLLVTHGPPLGILDLNSQKKSSGSAYLKEVVLQRKPKYHVFGHIHESSGMYKLQGVSFLNVAMSPVRLLI